MTNSIQKDAQVVERRSGVLQEKGRKAGDDRVSGQGVRDQVFASKGEQLDGRPALDRLQ